MQCHKKFVGNPCDAIEITELTKGIHNTSRTRGDTSKRSAPMTMRMLCLLWEFIEMFIAANPNSADEDICVMAGCATCFYLWLRIDEFFKLQMMHLQFDVNINHPSGNLCHLITLFFRKPDKNKDNEGRTYEVHKLPENEIGGCMNFFLGKWLTVCERMRGRPLEDEDYVFPRATTKGGFKVMEKMTQNKIFCCKMFSFYYNFFQQLS